jgi:hypothetical protein
MYDKPDRTHGMKKMLNSKKRKQDDGGSLRKGTLKCPNDSAELHFEIFQGMRMVRDGKYDAVCPKCNNYYLIDA